jgi:hypothetical protein
MMHLRRVGLVVHVMLMKDMRNVGNILVGKPEGRRETTRKTYA